jgi:homoserine dehydrogenase
MGSEKTLVIGMFGFGVVGEGLYKVLKQTPSLKASIKKVCIKNTNKKRNAPAELFTLEKNDLLFDPEINVIVEVINDSVAGYEIVTTALKNGKDVVSASKKMLSEHLPELIELQESTGRSLLYEASACASFHQSHCERLHQFHPDKNVRRTPQLQGSIAARTAIGICRVRSNIGY